MASVGLCMVILQRSDMVEESVVAIGGPVHRVDMCVFPVFESTYGPLSAVVVLVYGQLTYETAYGDHASGLHV